MSNPDRNLQTQNLEFRNSQIKIFLLMIIYLCFFLSVFSADTKPTAYFNPSQGYYDPVVDFGQFNEDYLESLILERVNQIRETYDAPPLSFDSRLNQAALSQAKDMKRWNRVSHTQLSFTKTTLTQRMRYFGVSFEHFGENIADVYLNTQLNVNFASRPIWVKTYKDAADTLVLSWKYSPGHFENMIDPQFKYTGVKVSFNSAKNTIYAAQVFGG